MRRSMRCRCGNSAGRPAQPESGSGKGRLMTTADGPARSAGDLPRHPAARSGLRRRLVDPRRAGHHHRAVSGPSAVDRRPETPEVADVSDQRMVRRLSRRHAPGRVDLRLLRWPGPPDAARGTGAGWGSGSAPFEPATVNMRSGPKCALDRVGPGRVRRGEHSLTRFRAAHSRIFTLRWADRLV